jgi:MoaA/NifB/PqqE/SkfB family radical SAM enzyme
MPFSTEKLANIRSFHEEIKSPHKDGSTSNAPLLLAIHATERCNFKCVHCFHTSTKEILTDMRLELFQAIVPMLQAAHELYLFGDGEVLLNIPRHLAMIARIYQQDPGCKIGFSTNGKLLTPEVYELYSTAGIQYIQLSVDAATKELYETMRRGGSFDELHANLEGIAALRRRSKARQPELHLATVISKQNYRQLPVLAEFAKRYGFSYWYINAESPQNPGRDLLSLTTGDLAELECIRADIMQNYSQCFLPIFDPSVGLPPDTSEKWLEAESPVFCTVPWQRFELMANGDVKICPYYHEPICSMNGKSILEVWNGDEFRHIRKAFTSGDDIPSYCIDCKLGMRRQYLPGFPGIPDILSLPDRILREVRAIRNRISG